ncbi:Predicted phospholipase, patatin/cPLA2 family [Evansella caseinilytica]|uniref:Predicted phospholipase, patatin/cPLA2 family n=1 Tax=Evansella caseinilytica TaxID=1503961 RepID=A0A1H3NM91_9BACI|nr:Predicted phospholipase, patatin/cPLA2 family [Evansella caseinilytica]
MNNVGIVLEGGGMRGVYTGGVLEYFLEKQLCFPYVAAVSAGACNGASYVAKQRGRNKAVTVDFASHPEYISYRRLIKNGELFNFDLIFEEIPNNLHLFDYESFFQSDQLFFTGTTDCETGEVIYFEKEELKADLNKILRASCSLPLVAPIVVHRGRPLLDGGVSDPIPLEKSIQDGNEKHVVILTQCPGYEKKPENQWRWLYRKKYRMYPQLLRLLETRWMIYNQSLKKVLEMEQEGRAFVFRPENLQNVGRLERKQEKLQALYNHGYAHAKERYEELLAFLTASPCPFPAEREKISVGRVRK